ncbi:YheC/YheD family endospore coat-associated protein [Bacillus sp. FJAT-45350]|uniref:YheC/YheD family endospore coat-associated protein n=1 Tax=Bacillus sp. FJAT-45350 TaxID=2011014 RepID=UPI000BB7DDDD|nr:YheC/YheD family protein [Bacillus sp. FJAT-45350]
MTTIYFNQESSTWGLQENEGLVWGFDKKRIPMIAPSPESVPFYVKRHERSLGPIVGLLTSDHSKKLFSGNKQTFRRIHDGLQQTGGLCFVITPDTICYSQLHGYVLINNNWVLTAIPLPDVIYNRVPTPRTEKSERMKRVFEWIKQMNIPFFNPHFFNKWDVHQTLSTEPTIANHLLFTDVVTSKETFREALANYKFLYLKPKEGQKGDGIFKLTTGPNQTYLIHDHTTSVTLFSFESLWTSVNDKVDLSNYLLQEGIHLNQLNDKKYDFRILCHKVQGEWNTSGIGVRSSKGITTHVPKGGMILSLKDISPPINFEKINLLIATIGKRLEQSYGNLGEFSVDIGRDTTGRYWLFEVNAKPMIFDEPTIQKQGLHNLIQAFYSESGYLEE